MTPAFDALLKEVEAASTDPYGTFIGKSANPVLAGVIASASAAPRLAAMLRVAVEAMRGVVRREEQQGGAGLQPLRNLPQKALRRALARIEAMAKGES